MVEVVLVDNGPGLDFETYHDEKETLGIELIKHLLDQSLCAAKFQHQRGDRGPPQQGAGSQRKLLS